MRPMRGCKKPRLVASSDEEDEAERDRLRDLVQRLPCYQGEGSLAIKTKKSVEEDMRQLEKVRNQLKEEIEYVANVKDKVEEDKAKVEKDKAQVEQEKVKVELAKLAVEEERLKVEEERVKVEKLSKELQSQVECPVCLTMPREDSAIPCCPQGHIVCSTCRDKLIRQDCPTCRVPMGQCQNLLALTVIKNVQHECGHQGCSVKLKLDQIKEHEETCVWRLIPCPGASIGANIRCGAIIPLCNVLNHAQGCPGCDWSPTQAAGEGIVMKHRIKVNQVEGVNWSWPTKVLKSEERFFFVKSVGEGGIYKVEVLMKGSQEDCEEFMVEASILNAETRKPVLKSLFHPRPLTDQNEAINCLSVPERGLSKAGKYHENGDKYTVVCSVNIVKQVNNRIDCFLLWKPSHDIL